MQRPQVEGSLLRLQAYPRGFASAVLDHRSSQSAPEPRPSSPAMAASSSWALVTGNRAWASLRATHVTLPALAARWCTLQGVAAGGSGWRAGAATWEAESRVMCCWNRQGMQHYHAMTPSSSAHLQDQQPTSDSSGRASQPAARRMQRRRRQHPPRHKASPRRLGSLARVRSKLSTLFTQLQLASRAAAPVPTPPPPLVQGKWARRCCAASCEPRCPAPAASAPGKCAAASSGLTQTSCRQASACCQAAACGHHRCVHPPASSAA